MDHLQEAYLAVYEANKADEFVTSSMYTNDKHIKDAKKRRRQLRDFEGVLNPADFDSQGEPVRQQAHRDRRGVKEGYVELNRKRMNRMSKQAIKHMDNDDWEKAYDIENQMDSQTPEWSKMQAEKNRNRPESEKRSKTVSEADSYDVVLDYLLDEGYADSEDNAITIMANMSEEWIDTILDEAAKDQSNKQIEKGVRTTYKAGNVLDNLHQGRSRGINRLDPRQRDAKVKRMRGRLKTRRDDLFGERNRREDEKVSAIKKLLGM